jgi:hypothetical protein
MAVCSARELVIGEGEDWAGFPSAIEDPLPSRLLACSHISEMNIKRIFNWVRDKLYCCGEHIAFLRGNLRS